MKILITAGATIEKLDPVRYISNFSSGKQGYAIAKVMSEAGFETTLISANSNIEIDNVKIIYVQSASEMLDASLYNLPVDIAIFTAAVCDWKAEEISVSKLKKTSDQESLSLNLIKNPDILKIISNHENRPNLVIGFAAETDNLIENARAKLKQKNCDIILANKITENNNPFGSDFNEIHYLTAQDEEYWPLQSKIDIAKKLLFKIKKR